MSSPPPKKKKKRNLSMSYTPHLIQNSHENEDATQTENIQQRYIGAY